MFRPNRMKARLKAGNKVLGFWSGLNSAIVAECLALGGVDFIVFDQEHGFGDPQGLVQQLQAISATQTSSIVRIPWYDPAYIKRVLDAGVEGIMVPNVETAEQARDVVAACRYPPRGVRGAAIGSVRASDFGSVADYGVRAAEELLIICQIETARAVENIAEIGAVDGVDVLFIGPSDLSASIHRLGDIAHPDVAALIEKAERGTRAAGKALGTVPHPGMTWRDMMERGYDMVNAGSDVRSLKDTAARAMAEFRDNFN